MAIVQMYIWKQAERTISYSGELIMFLIMKLMIGIYY